MSGLIRIQTVCRSNGIPERFKDFVEKVDFEKNQQTSKRMKKYPGGKELNVLDAMR